MAILKCKMCGGDIELSADKTFATCEYCGSSMTMPKIDDEQRAAAFNRGNHFRRIGEFDKALAVYERIVAENDADAEAHWCCALCRFGIEYVEDPATYDWLPTCHRASFDSFLDDVDYLAALEHSDGITKRQYQKDAAKITEVQRGILATSQNEEPFDIFICYKETDENGNRTVDSTLAQEIYYQLTEAGYRVFFSRITLEDKVGTQYEPYIFAALNSAKIMIAVGTKPEYLNAVWVKNEWSRFLSLMRKDRSKLILPCYRGMDPYDLPEQLSVLQSYDMSKIGFMQDLIHGINKVIKKDEPKTTVKETVVVQQNNGPDTSALLKRAFMFLEDGDWNSADEYCEKVLDIDPENAEAYLGKLMAELYVRERKALENCNNPFERSGNYQKAVRFGDEKLSAMLKDCNSAIKTRNEEARLENVYQSTLSFMNRAKNESDYNTAAERFGDISDYKDAAALKQTCHERAETCRRDSIYSAAIESASLDTIGGNEKAISLFESISGWRDTDSRRNICYQRIAELKANAEADRIEAERQAEIARREAEERARKAKKIAVIVTPVICIVVAFVFVLNNVILPQMEYNDAVALMDEGKYEEAIVSFEALGGFKDSYSKMNECKYNDAIALMDEGRFKEAVDAFKLLKGFKDSDALLEACTYQEAVILMNDGKYGKAIVKFNSIIEYRDSGDLAAICKNAIDKKLANGK